MRLVKSGSGIFVWFGLLVRSLQVEAWRRVLIHRAFLKAHTYPQREAQWRSRAKRNKCRRPSAASYAGFVLDRNEASCFGVAGNWARVVFHEGLSSHWGAVGLPASTACYPRVCSIAKRQVTYSGRGKKMRSHLANGRLRRPRNFSDARHS